MKRWREALHVLRGRPLMYKVSLDGPLSIPADANPYLRVSYCNFNVAGGAVSFSPSSPDEKGSWTI